MWGYVSIYAVSFKKYRRYQLFLQQNFSKEGRNIKEQNPHSRRYILYIVITLSMLFRLQIFALEIRKTCIQSAKQMKRNSRFFSRDLPDPVHDPLHKMTLEMNMTLNMTLHMIPNMNIMDCMFICSVLNIFFGIHID